MRSFFKYLKHTPIQLLIVILLGTLSYAHLSHELVSGLYAASQSLKAVLMVVLPFVILSSVAIAFADMPKGAGLFVLLLFACICLSNFVNVMFSGMFALWTISGEAGNFSAAPPSEQLLPLWNFSLPQILSNDKALFMGFVAGIFYSIRPVPVLYKGLQITNHYSMMFLQRVFIPLLPLFVLGFLLKLLHDNILVALVNDHAELLVKMLLLLVGYLAFLLLVACGGNGKLFMQRARTIASPAIAAFTSMSSASALPFSIAAAKENTGNEPLAQMVMPTTVNIHMVGDTICIPIIAMILLASCHMPLPSLHQYTLFAAYFVLAKFSGAGVPGGTILVMIPVLEKTLGFTGEMSAVITTLYILIDCFTTTGNVIGNNIFVLYMSKLYNAVQRAMRRLQPA